ncbi:hypothetical protein AVEN_66456-1 [Araneus ventricosus]|uniref:Uncharacterized protein n=1 Tax=Araneus ventricosus TaxID=182803 RepID=A0A4Y2RJ75_ARAVE|nr:hypothetical protein AVEN_66456-1 [Araneus ventricosus]
MMSKPCPQMDTKGTVIGDATHPGMFAVRNCAENGSWVENRTNFSLCITNMAVRRSLPSFLINVLFTLGANSSTRMGSRRFIARDLWFCAFNKGIGPLFLDGWHLREDGELHMA